MVYFNGKRVIFSPRVNIYGGLEGTHYVPVVVSDAAKNNGYPQAVVVTEEIVENGLYMFRFSEGTQDRTPYLISGADVDSMYNEKTMPLPQIGNVSSNIINEHTLSSGMIIAKEQGADVDGCIFVTSIGG